MALREIGIGFPTLQSMYTRPRSHTALARDCLTEARLAEDLGFDSFWFSEHHHSYDGYNPSPLTLGAHVAAATTRIGLGAGIIVAPLHTPGEIASSVSALRAIAPGRPLRLGLGLGYREEEFAATGYRVAQRKRLFEQHIEAMRSEPALDSVEWWFAGVTSVALRRAGSYGAGVLLQAVTPAKIGKVVENYRAAFRPGLHDEPRVGLVKEVWVDTDRGRLRDVTKRVRAMWDHYASTLVEDIDDPRQRAHADEVARTWTDQSLLGTPDEVLDELTQLVRGGVDLLTLRVRFDGSEHTAVARCMQLLADEVLPTLRQEA